MLLTACAGPRIFVTPPQTIPQERKIENVNIALALGGGGSRGIAHLGVLDVLERNGIPIDLIVGTSAGSIIGAFYADYQDSKLLHSTLINLKKWDILDLSIWDSIQFFTDIRAPIQGYYLEEFIVKNMTVNNIEELKIPFVAVATDLHTEKPFRISTGPIATAVHASSAAPPVFSPVKAYGKLLVDGGVVEPVPVNTARLHSPKVVIAVDISTLGKDYTGLTMYDMTMKSLHISYYTLSTLQSKSADVLIHPNTEGFGK